MLGVEYYFVPNIILLHNIIILYILLILIEYYIILYLSVALRNSFHPQTISIVKKIRIYTVADPRYP